MAGASLSRLEREALHALARRMCAAEGRHPPGRAFWQLGDWATPDRLVCGRCFATLAQRPHEPQRERQGSGES